MQSETELVLLGDSEKNKTENIKIGFGYLADSSILRLPVLKNYYDLLNRCYSAVSFCSL